MKVVALLNAEAKGTLTDAEQLVGAITLCGAVWGLPARSRGD